MSNLKLKINVADSAKRTEELEIAKALSKPLKQELEEDKIVYIQIVFPNLYSYMLLQYGKPHAIMRDMENQLGEASIYHTLRILDKDNKILLEHPASIKLAPSWFNYYEQIKKPSLLGRLFRTKPKIIKTITHRLLKDNVVKASEVKMLLLSKDQSAIDYTTITMMEMIYDD